MRGSKNISRECKFSFSNKFFFCKKSMIKKGKKNHELTSGRFHFFFRTLASCQNRRHHEDRIHHDLFHLHPAIHGRLFLFRRILFPFQLPLYQESRYHPEDHLFYGIRRRIHRLASLLECCHHGLFSRSDRLSNECFSRFLSSHRFYRDHLACYLFFLHKISNIGNE